MIRRLLTRRYKRIGRAGDADAADLADLHALSFRHAWAADDFTAMLRNRANRSWIAHLDFWGRRWPVGALICTLAADEAEVTSLFIAPKWQRTGLAAQLLAVARLELSLEGARRWHLEVDEANQSAISLYQKFGFLPVGKRKAYYPGEGDPSDALMLQRNLP